MKKLCQYPDCKFKRLDLFLEIPSPCYALNCKRQVFKSLRFDF